MRLWDPERGQELRTLTGHTSRVRAVAWGQLGDRPAEAEPKTLRYRVLHAAARLVRGGRRRRLKIQATWPWAEAITAAWQRIDALPQAP